LRFASSRGPSVSLNASQVLAVVKGGDGNIFLWLAEMLRI